MKHIYNCCSEIVQKRDKDIPNPQKLSSFCSNKTISQEAATSLFNSAKGYAQQKDYSTAVRFDEFASEFLSSDNSFCFTWCNHIFRELAPRANANEVKALLTKAIKLKLTEQQISGFKSNFAKLASKTSPEKGIAICKLFIGEKDFDAIYIGQAEKLAENNSSAINANELLGVIKANTTEDSFVDALTPFVPHITSFVPIFTTKAIDKIKRHKSVDFLKKYWAVREDMAFFDSLVNSSSDIKDDVVSCIVTNNTQFLQKPTLLNHFLKVIERLHDNVYAYNVLEQLLKNGCEVLSNFLVIANKRCDTSSGEETVAIIDHTLEAINYKKLREASWIPLFLRKRKIQEGEKLTLSQKAAFYKETVDVIIHSSIDFQKVDENSYFTLWQDYISLILKKASSQPKETAIKDMVNVREQVANYCKSFATYMALCDNLTQRVAKYCWEVGNEQEEDCEFEKAISTYRDTINENVSAYSKKAEYRYLICKVKAGQITEEVEQDIDYLLQQKSNQALHDDLAYRYACFLIKAIRPDTAERVIENYMPSETQLSEICKNLYVKESEKYLQEFNDKFSLIEQGKLSLDESINFYNGFLRYKNVISRNLTDTTNKFVSYRRKLESYIIKSYFDEQKYEEAFEKLQRLYPNFFEDDSNFRNVAIAALGTVESEHEVSDETYKSAISIWLSAIYSDRLFVKSLNYTSWDDQYTFTLEGSLGNSSEDDYESLPDNVNFDRPVENENIAIVDVQNSLVSRMETYIRDNHPKFEDFFNSEKNALDALIGLRLDEPCIIAAPYFAKQAERVLESVKDSFDVELSHGYCNEEDVLSLGVQYGFADGNYGKYKEAKDWADLYQGVANISGKEMQQKLANLPKIRQFEKLYASVKSFFSNKMNESIKAKMNYRQFIDTYEPICLAFKDTPLSMAFSQYANGEVVRLLNDNTMALRDGIVYMVHIYKVAPSSIQVKKNLEGMLCNLAASCAETPNSSDERVVNLALRDTGSDFREAVEDARIQGALSAIVEKVNNNKMTKQKALDEVYDLYMKSPNNDRLCENIVTLCDLCIGYYIIGQETGSDSVKNKLDLLNNNKSETFKRHALKLAQEYSKIVSQLSTENKILLGIDDGIDFASRMVRITLEANGTTLNERGRALKTGLEYYKKLGGYVRPRRSQLFDEDLPF